MASYFTTRTFDFLQDLEVHNDRDWFQANRDRYEEDVRDPMLAFVADAQPRLATISKHLVADPRRSGGSMFRINRDVRFSADKSPYKTHTGAQFRHAAGRDVHAPGLYLHLEPGNVGMGAGMWMPDNATLRRIRTHLDDNRAAWKRVRNAEWFKAWDLHGASLKRAPRGWDPDHPLIEDLRRTSWALMRPATEEEATSEGFLDLFIERCAETKPFLRFLCRAIDVPF